MSILGRRTCTEAEMLEHVAPLVPEGFIFSHWEGYHVTVPITFPAGVLKDAAIRDNWFIEGNTTRSLRIGSFYIAGDRVQSLYLVVRMVTPTELLLREGTK